MLNSVWRWTGSHRVFACMAMLGGSLALLLAFGLIPVHAEETSKAKGEAAKETAGAEALQAAGPDVVAIQIIKKDGTITQRPGQGAREWSSFQPSDVKWDGACSSEEDCKSLYGGQSDIHIGGRLSKQALGIPDDMPVRRVIPRVIVEFGSGTCYQDCSGNPGGSGQCDCFCTNPNEQCP